MHWLRALSYFILSSLTVEIAFAQSNTPAPAVSKSAAKPAATQTADSNKPAVPAHKSSSNNMWGLIASNFSLPHYTNTAEVQKQIKWFAAHPQYFQKVATQGQPYFYYIYQEVRRRHLPGELVLLPMIESAYDPFAYSWVGAAGLWQMMPATGSNFGLKQDWWYDGRKDVLSSTKAALDYLTYLQTFFNGNWPLAIAAYNSGEGTVQNAINRNAHKGLGTTFWELHLPTETESYVPRLLALAAIVSNPGKYGVELPPLKYGPYFEVIQLRKQIELSQAAKMASISLSELYELNPGYSRWATDPKGPYTLLLPIAKINIFEEKYELAFGPNNIINPHHTHGPAEAEITQGGTAIKGNGLNPYAQNVMASLDAAPVSTPTIAAAKPTIVKPSAPAPAPAASNDASQHASSTASAPAQAKPAEPAQITYYVKAGDTLWSIAKHFNVTVGEILTWNNLSERQRVHIGQALIIKVKGQKGAQNNKNKYVVKPGDTLFSIARAHGLHLSQIEAKNPSIDATQGLNVGEAINI